MRNVPFRGTSPGSPFDVAGWLSRIGVEEHGEPGNGAFIIFAFPAHVTHPGREVGNGNEFLPEPCEIGDVPKMHDTRGAFTTWKGGDRVGEYGLLVHLTLHSFWTVICGMSTWLVCLITCHSSGGQ